MLEDLKLITECLDKILNKYPIEINENYIFKLIV